MAKTLAAAKLSYREKLAVMPTNYVKGVAAFLGASEAHVRGRSPAQAYIGVVKPGLEDKWETGIKQRWGV